MKEEQTRRQFLQGLATLFLTGAIEPAFAAKLKTTKCAAPARAKYKVSGWTGDDFTIGHKFRGGDFPQFSDAPEKTVDFIIVGGGVAGLTSAFYLRDHDVLLLEQYEQLGGNSRGGTYKGVDYSYGAAYIDTVDGIYGKLWSDLGITPQKLPAADNAFFWHKRFERAIPLMQKFAKENAAAIQAASMDDDPLAVMSTDVAKLDAMPFSEMLKGQPADFIALLDSICRSSVCGGTQRVSALIGLSLVEDLSSSNYVFEGGNSAISRALVAKLDAAGSGRLQRGTFVWRIDLKDDGAVVMYTSKDGHPHTVACKHLIVATPPMVAWRQLKNIDDKVRAQLMQFKYGSYLVANCLMNKRIFQGAYDNFFFNAPYSIADATVADTPYVLAKKYKPGMGSVLTVYNPWEPGSEGRMLLMQGDKDKFAKSIHDQVKTFVSQLDNHLEEIVLTRWGHAIAVPGPNYYSRLAKLHTSLAASTAPYSLAHSSVNGGPSAESAIRGARYAADRALRIIK